MPLQNRVDPWGDLHTESARGMFTGNRGCLVDDAERLVRHHRGSLWITCRTTYRGWRHPLTAPRTWTPLFFLDDAVALAAGHRPCGLCRRTDYLAYRQAVTTAVRADKPVLADQLNRRLAFERLRRGRGVARAANRILTLARLDALPVGAVIANPVNGAAHLVTDHHLQPFGFGGWGVPVEHSRDVEVEVLTPPTTIAALTHGFTPRLHETAHIRR